MDGAGRGGKPPAGPATGPHPICTTSQGPCFQIQSCWGWGHGMWISGVLHWSLLIDKDALGQEGRRYPPRPATLAVSLRRPLLEPVGPHSPRGSHYDHRLHFGKKHPGTWGTRFITHRSCRLHGTSETTQPGRGSRESLGSPGALMLLAPGVECFGLMGSLEGNLKQKGRN